MIAPMTMKGCVGVAAVIAGFLAPDDDAFATRYAGPGGTSAQSCSAPASACDLNTAIEGDGANVPSAGEEVIILPGDYTLSDDVSQGASNLFVHGDFTSPRPQITVPAPPGRISMLTGTFSYVSMLGVTSEPVNMAAGATVDRVFLRGTSNNSSAICQCYGALIRNSVFITSGTAPALGVTSNGGSANTTYRNVTAYSTSILAPAIALRQQAASGTLTATATNVIALNTAGGADVLADGPNSTITLSHSNYRTVAEVQAGVVQDAPGEDHQTELPLLVNAGAGDFSQLSDSPTINAGVSDPLNGTLDFAGGVRTFGPSTDIGADEFSPAPPPPTTPGPGGSPPTFALGRKVKVKRSGKGRLAFTCTAPTADSCTVAGRLTAKKRSIGVVNGTVSGGTTATVRVKLNRKGRRRLASKSRLKAALSGEVRNAAGLGSPLAAPLKLKARR
jgi:hypothetical protein